MTTDPPPGTYDVVPFTRDICPKCGNYVALHELHSSSTSKLLHRKCAECLEKEGWE